MHGGRNAQAAYVNEPQREVFDRDRLMHRLKGKAEQHYKRTQPGNYDF